MDKQPAARSPWHHRGYLPHFETHARAQFVTFRLVDSLPRAVAESLPRDDDPLARAIESERHLDRGYGACWLREPAVASLVEEAMRFAEGTRYQLLAWVVMPNHVHAVVRTLPEHSLGGIVRTWKSYSARRANEYLRRRGPFWYPEYFDRYVRDEEHLRRVIRYVHGNPVKAGLVPGPEKWPWSSAREAVGRGL